MGGQHGVQPFGRQVGAQRILQAVDQHEVLLRIDTRSQEAQVASQKAALDKARADLGIATLNYENSERLLARKFIAQNVLDTARSVRDAAAASVELARAQLRLAEIGLFFARLAVLTFGGAYAVLPYVYQGADEHLSLIHISEPTRPY